MKYVIGTRGSKLALAQAEYVREALQRKYANDAFELKIIKTKGDTVLDRPLDKVGGKGIFVKEIEQQILSHEVDIGVHSMKDMPSHVAKGLTFAKAWKREDPRDALVLREKHSLEELPENAVIATGSKRRAYQLLKLRPDIRTADIRGNVDTRLKKMEEQGFDGLVLAAAGLKRLGLEDRITCFLDPDEMIPAPAQGILALEIRREDAELCAMLDALSDEQTQFQAAAERGFLAEIGGSCHTPVGALCSKIADKEYELSAVFGDEDGSRIAFARVKGCSAEQLALDAAREIRAQLAGKVFLIGAGPGDPGLITVKGAECLKRADCIIYDRLAAPELLAYARPDCELIYAGKENRNHTMKQEEINRLLVSKATAYRNVVRLKGGDVYVFGRGGEEGLYLKEHGVRFEVVPGVTSAVAGPAYAGIPVTHRGIASGFHVVTAHSSKDELADIDFKAMAQGEETCVFLMGLGKLSEIASNLLAAGMSSDTPAAVISHATTPLQKTVAAPLSEISQAAAKAGLTSPALIVVGAAAALRENLNFFEEKPLFGKKCLVTKVGSASSPLSNMLRQNGAYVREVQTGSIKCKDFAVSADDISAARWLLFTSRNGVSAFMSSLLKSGLDARSLRDTKIAAIGEKSADELEKFGLHADFIPTEYNSTAFCDEFKKLAGRDDTVWYLKASNAGEDIASALCDACVFKETAVYENEAVPIDIGEDELLLYDALLFTCASSAVRLLGTAGRETVRKLNEKGNVFAIGPSCKRALEDIGITSVHMAAKATYEALASELLKN